MVQAAADVSQLGKVQAGQIFDVMQNARDVSRIGVGFGQLLAVDNDRLRKVERRGCMGNDVRWRLRKKLQLLTGTITLCFLSEISFYGAVTTPGKHLSAHPAFRLDLAFAGENEPPCASKWHSIQSALAA